MAYRELRSAAGALAAAIVALLAFAQGALAATFLSVTIVCTPTQIIGGEQFYTIDHYATVSGFPPNTAGDVVIIIEDFGDFRQILITTDATGSGSGQLLNGPIETSGPIPGTPWSATATFGGETATVSGVISCGGAPASKDDCKEGGWEAFGTFRNQGDCVSFVSTRGKKAPAGP